MSKYHIKKDGSPGVCKATHNCPLGDANEHYNSVEEAQQYSDYLNNQSETVMEAFPDVI